MPDGFIGAGLVLAHEGEAGEADDGDFCAGAAEFPVGESLDAFGDVVCGFNIGEEAFEADGTEAGSTDHADEGSSFHGLGYDGTGSMDPQQVLVWAQVRLAGWVGMARRSGGCVVGLARGLLGCVVGYTGIAEGSGAC